MDDQTKKILGYVVGAIGLISSLIGIYAFLSGRQSPSAGWRGGLIEYDAPDPGP
jgi:hypothetical protein